MTELIDRLRNGARNTTLPKSARDLLAEAADELQATEASFDLRWNADMRAIRRWQVATGRKLTWPDHADLVVWQPGGAGAGVRRVKLWRKSMPLREKQEPIDDGDF